jgi:serine/threonine-protein kinase
MNLRRSIVATAVVLVTATSARSTRADAAPQDRAAARSLFDEGRKLAHAGRYADACPKFEESQRLDAGIGTLFNLADCYEHVDRLASAWSDFLEVADAAKRAGDAEREKVARGRADKLAGRLARITFALAGGANGATIKLDGSVLGAGALGAGLPVDQGSHVVEASATGKKPWTSRVEVADGQATTVTVPALEDEAPPAPPPPVQAPAAPPVAPAPPEPSGGWMRPAGIAAGAVGLVGLGIGTFFGLQARSQWSSAQPRCPNGGCDQQGYDSWSSSRSSATASTVAFAAGGAAVAAGVVLFLLAPSSPSQSRVGVALDRVSFTVDLR